MGISPMHSKTNTEINITNVSDDVVVVAYENDDSQGELKTFRISSSGRLTLIDTLVFEPETHMHDIQIIKVSDGIFAIAYKGDGNDGFITTVGITNDGEIADAIFEKLLFDDDDPEDNNLNITLVTEGDADGDIDGVVAVVYADDDDDEGILITFTIDPDDGDITFVETLTYQPDSCHSHDMDIVRATGDIFASAHVSDCNDG